jgi:hypothetical protein
MCCKALQGDFIWRSITTFDSTTCFTRNFSRILQILQGRTAALKNLRHVVIGSDQSVFAHDIFRFITTISHQLVTIIDPTHHPDLVHYANDSIPKTLTFINSKFIQVLKLPYMTMSAPDPVDAQTPADAHRLDHLRVLELSFGPDLNMLHHLSSITGSLCEFHLHIEFHIVGDFVPAIRSVVQSNPRLRILDLVLKSDNLESEATIWEAPDTFAYIHDALGLKKKQRIFSKKLGVDQLESLLLQKFGVPLSSFRIMGKTLWHFYICAALSDPDIVWWGSYATSLYEVCLRGASASELLEAQQIFLSVDEFSNARSIVNRLDTNIHNIIQLHPMDSVPPRELVRALVATACLAYQCQDDYPVLSGTVQDFVALIRQALTLACPTAPGMLLFDCVGDLLQERREVEHLIGDLFSDCADWNPRLNIFSFNSRGDMIAGMFPPHEQLVLNLFNDGHLDARECLARDPGLLKLVHFFFETVWNRSSGQFFRQCFDSIYELHKEGLEIKRPSQMNYFPAGALFVINSRDDESFIQKYVSVFPDWEKVRFQARDILAAEAGPREMHRIIEFLCKYNTGGSGELPEVILADLAVGAWSWLLDTELHRTESECFEIAECFGTPPEIIESVKKYHVSRISEIVLIKLKKIRK